jgi:predicted transcriptional regulator
MGKKKRVRLEVIYDLLRLIRNNNNSIKPTPLLRYSNLSSQIFNKYFSELMEKGFIKAIRDREGRKFITLTDKGFEYLKKYRNIKRFVTEFDL